MNFGSEAASRPACAGALGQVREQLLVQLLLLAARGDEAVADAPGELGGERPRGGDVDRHRLVGPVVDRRSVGPVVLALEGDALVGPEAADQLDRLRQPQPALLRARPLARPSRASRSCDSPVPTPRKTRPGLRQASVANACATIAGW